MKIPNKELYYDTLREICSFGAGHAASSLSNIVEKKVVITVPEVCMRSVKEQMSLMGDESKAVVMVNSQFELGESGMIFYLATIDNAKSVVGAMTCVRIGELGELEKSAMVEIGNILSGSIIGSVSNFMEEKVFFNPPNLYINPPHKVLGATLGKQIRNDNPLLFVSVDISVEEEDISSTLLFVPLFDLVAKVWDKMSARGLLADRL
jgi:chemotaxis protein CheC